MKLSHLLSGLPVTTITGEKDIEVTGVTKDSRNAHPGCIFFSTAASERYAAEAAQQGAQVLVSDREAAIPFPCTVITPDPLSLLGIVASRFYGLPSRKLSVIGITGTNGKTTTAYLVESVFRAAEKQVGLIGTITYRYGNRILKAENTTPGAAELHGLLKEMYDCSTEYVVMEVSSHALAQKRVEGVDFDIAVFTNLTRDHLDYHGTPESYKEAKGLFFHHYLKESAKEKRCAVLNLDDPACRDFVPAAPVKTLFYSLSTATDAYMIGYDEKIDGLTAELSLKGRSITVKSPLLGVFNISNILAACLSGIAADIPLHIIQKGIEALEGVPGRLERVRNEKGIFAFVDYAHTPDALKQVLELLGSLKRARLIVVFGCGGDRDRGKRPVMGDIASRLADFSIITSDNPRSEEPGQIIDEIKKGMKGNSFKVIEDRRNAILEGARMARADDVLLVAGKGHEDYQIIGQEVVHFNDREVIEESLGVAYR